MYAVIASGGKQEKVSEGQQVALEQPERLVQNAKVARRLAKGRDDRTVADDDALHSCFPIPVAAGVLYPWFGILLSPMLAGAAMSLSSVSVIANALRLRGFQPSNTRAGQALDRLKAEPASS